MWRSLLRDEEDAEALTGQGWRGRILLLHCATVQS